MTCKNCEERTPTCHDTCERYKDWSKALADAKKASMDAGSAVSFLADNYTRRRNRWRRRMGRRK